MLGNSSSKFILAKNVPFERRTYLRVNSIFISGGAPPGFCFVRKNSQTTGVGGKVTDSKSQNLILANHIR